MPESRPKPSHDANRSDHMNLRLNRDRKALGRKINDVHTLDCDHNSRGGPETTC